jgi:predicted RNase H-like HicB family nuclease
VTHKYEIIIYWSDEDKVYIAEVPELPGCVAHGTTPESTLSNCGDAMDLWLETAREFGRAIPEPKGRRLQFA